jgi:hypothetical protein
VYGFLDLSLRSSRMLIVLGALWAALSVLSLRFLIHFLKNKNLKLGTEGVKNLVIVGAKTEVERVKSLLNNVGVAKNHIGIVCPDETDDHHTFLGSLRQLDEIVRIYRVEEVIFCSKDVAANDIMAWMSRLGAGIEMRIVPEESHSIIGSSDKNTRGELYTIDIRFNIAQPVHRRNKRLLDMIIGFLLLIISPLCIAFAKNGLSFFKNIFQLILGKQTLVGYTEGVSLNLPKLKKGILSPIDSTHLTTINEPTMQRLNFLYAKDYDVWRDVEILWTGWRKVLRY